MTHLKNTILYFSIWTMKTCEKLSWKSWKFFVEGHGKSWNYGEKRVGTLLCHTAAISN